MTWITMMVWSLTYRQTSWSVKSSGLQEASQRMKQVEVMELQLSYLKSQKIILLKCCTQYVSKFRKLSIGHRTGKDQFSFQSQRKKGSAKECLNYHTVALISHASKVMLKILQQYKNQKCPDVQTGFRKDRGTRDQIANIHWIIGKLRELNKKHLRLLH